MAYYPIITAGPGSPRENYFLLSGNQLSNFSSGDRFIAYDSGIGSPATSSAIYVFTVAASDSSPAFSAVQLDGGNTRVYVTETIPNIELSGRSWVQATNGVYYIPWSDPSKNASSPGALVIQPATLDSTTDINLPGRGTLGYGEAINTTLLHLLENFAGPNPPGFGSPSQESPVEGQLWFDTSVPASPIIRVWNATAMNWDGFQGSGREFDERNGDGSPSTVVSTSNVAVQTKTGNLAFQQVFLNGVLQREAASAADMTGSPSGGNYYVSAANEITFAFTVDITDEVTVYAL